MIMNIATFLLLLSVAIPVSAAPPSKAKQPGASPGVSLELIAERVQSAGPSGTVQAGGIQWLCSGSRCTARVAGNPLNVAACRSLVRQVGMIKSFGNAAARLDHAQLRTCNAVSGPVASAAGAGAPPVAKQPPGPGFVQGDLKPAPLTRPSMRAPASISQSPAIGKSDFAGPAVTPGPIREAASRPMILGIRGDQNICVQRRVTLTGRNFGDKQYHHNLVLQGPRGEFVQAVSRIHHWSATRIDAEMPAAAAVRPDQRYQVAIQDPQRRTVAVSPAVQVCVDKFTVAGDIRLANCNVTARNLSIEVRRNGNYIATARIVSNPTDDFSYRYISEVSAVPGRYELVARAGPVCPGGVWTPERHYFAMDFVRHRASPAFEYRVNLVEHSVSMLTLADVVDGMLRQMRVRLNNFDANTRWRKWGDSYIRFPEALVPAPANEIRLEIEPAVNGPRQYFINDVNLSSVRVYPSGRDLRVELKFENEGMELIGDCRNDLGCLVGAPDVELDLKIDIYLTLDRHRNRPDGRWDLSFSRVNIVTNVNAQADGLCLVFDYICTAVNDYRALIRETVERNLRAQIDTPALRNQVGRALRPLGCRGELQSVGEDRGWIRQYCRPMA